jgi:uncharacterized surface protein with fasciclin (FAS1) repeats
MKKNLLVLALLSVFLFSVGFAQTERAAAQTFVPNIMDIAAADDRFDTLEAAIKAAGLADTLASSNNTFTVFAPTDAAFAALPAGTVESLLADPKGALTDVLLYHVVAGEQKSGAVLASDSLMTLQGTSLDVNLRNGLPYVNGSQIIITDIEAKNGVIHVIDAVLVPTSSPAPAKATEQMDKGAALPTIAEIAIADGRFNTLVAALTAADLAGVFLAPGDYTVFAPTDDAFAALPAGTVEALLADPSGLLTNILLYHVVGDSLSRDQIATDDFIPTLEGRSLVVNRSGSNIVDISGAKLLITNIQASNGVIHVIDTVLVP